MRLLAEALHELDLDPVLTREPGGTSLGERLREIVLDPSETTMADRTEAMVYAAARAQHVAEVISPALDDGRVVLSDRYVDSSIVYQGVGRGLGSQEVARLNRWATDGVQPDLVVLLDVPAEEGIVRAGASPDRLESAGPDFHERVNEAFRRLAAMTPSRYLVVNATLPVDEVHRRIRTTVLRRLDPSALDVDDAGREAVEVAREEALVHAGTVHAGTVHDGDVPAADVHDEAVVAEGVHAGNGQAGDVQEQDVRDADVHDGEMHAADGHGEARS
jgi:dTMP kinase